MVNVNGYNLDPSQRFPDGTLAFKIEHIPVATNMIIWRYENDGECMMVWNAVNHLRANGADSIIMYLPYIPNARMDRVKSQSDVFTLKWFAKFLNALELDSVFVLDPHSHVSTALIDRVKNETEGLSALLWNAVKSIREEYETDVLYCYPDEGAVKRYSEFLDGDYVYCSKKRNWVTGKVESLVLSDPEKVKGRNVLIVDDICSKGTTFMKTASALKEAGANLVFLHVTHCEDTIFKGDILKDDSPIEKVYTSDSIFRGSHAKVVVRSA